ncbi:MAG: lamin tail domain-containing protein [Patescibacteria group bacterium]
MVYISEILTNPIGDDARGEWVEIGNSGTEVVSLVGWSLTTKSGKKAALFGEIAPGDLRVFSRSETRLSFRNTDEELALFRPDGTMVVRASFPGTSIEGKSLNYEKNFFLPGKPTPGKENILALIGVVETPYLDGASLVPSNLHAPAGALVGVAILCAGSILFIVKTNAALHHLFFAGDKKTRE